MINEGPALEHLTRRVANTPSDFLADPFTNAGKGVVHVPAVVSDLLEIHQKSATVDLVSFAPNSDADSKRQASITLLLCWLLADPEIIERRPSANELGHLLKEGAASLTTKISPAKYRDDPERREEIVRYALAQIGLRPRGETKVQAEDRLTALNASERARVVAAARQAEERARSIREALARKAAQESADKYTRE